MAYRITWVKTRLPATAVWVLCGGGTLALGGCALAALPMIAPGAGVALGNAVAQKPKTKLVAMQVSVDQASDSQLKCPDLLLEKQRMAEVIANAGVIEVPIDAGDGKAGLTNAALDVGSEAAKNVAVSSMGGLGTGVAGVANGMKQQGAQSEAQTEKLNEMRLRIQATQAVNDAQKRSDKLVRLQKQRKCT